MHVKVVPKRTMSSMKSVPRLYCFTDFLPGTHTGCSKNSLKTINPFLENKRNRLENVFPSLKLAPYCLAPSEKRSTIDRERSFWIPTNTTDACFRGIRTGIGSGSVDSLHGTIILPSESYEARCGCGLEEIKVL